MGRIEQNTDMANVADTAVMFKDRLPESDWHSAVCLSNGYEVFGLEEILKEQKHRVCKEQPEKFHAVVCDITDTQALCAHIKEIDKNYRVTVLVNNAGVGYYGLHEELNPKKIQENGAHESGSTDDSDPQQLLQALKEQGDSLKYILCYGAQFESRTAVHTVRQRQGCPAFAKSLFDEVRKYGVRVITIQPDMAKTDLYRNADFCEGEEEASYLLPEEVAEAAAFALAQREGLVVTEITTAEFHRIRRK